MTPCDGGCPGYICADCDQHVHPWDGDHLMWCPPGMRRVNGRLLAAFFDALKDATGVISPTGMIHAVDCSTVRAHITWNQADSAYNWRPWKAVYGERVVGKTGLCCSPSVLVQPRRRRLVRRLTGLGWPDDDGRCARGHLPLWTREAP